MSRALSIMQWQRRKAKKETGIGLSWVARWSAPYGGEWNLWTNRNSVITNIVFSITTNATPVGKYGSQAFLSGGSWSWGSGYGSIPPVSWLIRIEGKYELQSHSFTNFSAFSISNGTLFATNLSIVTNSIGLTPAFMASTAQLRAVTNFALAPGNGINVDFAGLESAWGSSLSGLGRDGVANLVSSEIETAARAFIMAEWDRMWATYGIGSTPALGDYYPEPYGITNNLCLLPYFDARYADVYGVYRVQFTALTNYLDHAPAR